MDKSDYLKLFYKATTVPAENPKFTVWESKWCVGTRTCIFKKRSVVFLVLHLILVVKQQTQVLGGRCCHPIFNSPLCVKITISFKWTIPALLSMVAQAFLWSQFIISLFVLCEGCSHRCRLASWWFLRHILFRVLFAVGNRINEWKSYFTRFSDLLMHMANCIKTLVV